MRVYNLTASNFNYRNRTISPNGGSEEYSELSKENPPPNRDLALETNKVLAFGSLPTWWTKARELEEKRRKVALEAQNKAPVVPQLGLKELPVVEVAEAVEAAVPTETVEENNSRRNFKQRR